MSAVDGQRPPVDIESQRAPQKTSFWTRNAFPEWGQYILATGALLASSVAAWQFVVPNYPAAGVLTAVAVSEVFGFFRLRALKTEKNFEENISSFNKEKEALADENAKLEKEVAALQGVEKTYQDQVDKGASNIAQLKKTNQALQDDIDLLKSQFEANQKLLNKMQTLYADLKKTVDTARADAHQFHDTEELISDTISEEAKAVEKGVSDIKEENQEFSSLAQKFHVELETLTKTVTLFQQEQQGLKTILEALKESENKATQGTVKAKEVEEKLHAQNRALEKQLQQLQKLLAPIADSKKRVEKRD